MDDEKIQQQRKTLENIFAQYSCDNGKPSLVENYDESGLPESLKQLPNFSLIHKVIQLKEKLLGLQDVKKQELSQQSFNESQKIAYEIENFLEETVKGLDFLCAMSHDIEYALRNPSKLNSVCLPHHLHKKTSDFVEACGWLVKNRKWHPAECNKDLTALVSKLEQELEDWKSFVTYTDKCVQENIFVKEHIQKLAEGDNSYKFCKYL